MYFLKELVINSFQKMLSIDIVNCERNILEKSYSRQPAYLYYVSNLSPDNRP